MTNPPPNGATSRSPAPGDPPSRARGNGNAAPDHRAPGATRRHAVDGENDAQALVDGEQTLADGDQTLSDADQTGSDSDQTSADCDQLAADRDQAASDRDLAAGVDRQAHEISRDLRERSALRREHTAEARLEAAGRRDAIARARDLAALARDQAAAGRDLAMAQHDAVLAQDAGVRPGVTGDEIVTRTAERRRRAAQSRAQAAEQRALAAEDRQAAASDREQAARERLDALADRQAFAHELAIAAIDPLTGARARAAGLGELDRELDRSRRTSGLLVVAYVDVVGLKSLNDTAGHDAGDRLLKRVVALIKAHLRPYDLIIRLGGDEFLCALSNTPMLDVRERFGAIAAALAGEPDARAIRTGFAQLTPEDTAAELIARADRELNDTRRGDHDPGRGPTASRPPAALADG